MLGESQSDKGNKEMVESIGDSRSNVDKGGSESIQKETWYQQNTRGGSDSKQDVFTLELAIPMLGICPTYILAKYKVIYIQGY